MSRKFGQRGVAGRFRVAKHLPLAALFAHELTQTFESFGVVSFAETGEMVPDGNQSSVGGDVEVAGFEIVVAEAQLGQSRLQFIERRPQGFGIELCGADRKGAPFGQPMQHHIAGAGRPGVVRVGHFVAQDRVFGKQRCPEVPKPGRCLFDGEDRGCREREAEQVFPALPFDFRFGEATGARQGYSSRRRPAGMAVAERRKGQIGSLERFGEVIKGGNGHLFTVF